MELVEMAVECGFVGSFGAGDSEDPQIADYGNGGDAW